MKKEKWRSKDKQNVEFALGPVRHTYSNSTRNVNKRNTHTHCLSTVNTAATEIFYYPHIYYKKRHCVIEYLTNRTPAQFLQ